MGTVTVIGRHSYRDGWVQLQGWVGTVTVMGRHSYRDG